MFLNGFSPVKKQREHKVGAHSPPPVSLCVILTPSRFSVWICMTSPLSLCTGARPEICLSPKNIRIPTQEGRLGSSAARAEGQRAGGEERWGQQRGRKERRGERLSLGRFPAARSRSVRLAPCSLGPVEQSTGRLPCNWDSSFHTENRTATPRQRRVRMPPLRVDFCFDLKPSQIQKLAIIRKQKSSYIKKPK